MSETEPTVPDYQEYKADLLKEIAETRDKLDRLWGSYNRLIRESDQEPCEHVIMGGECIYCSLVVEDDED
jgi:hypothetical protein